MRGEMGTGALTRLVGEMGSTAAAIAERGASADVTRIIEAKIMRWREAEWGSTGPRASSVGDRVLAGVLCRSNGMEASFPKPGEGGGLDRRPGFARAAELRYLEERRRTRRGVTRPPVPAAAVRPSISGAFRYHLFDDVLDHRLRSTALALLAGEKIDHFPDPAPPPVKPTYGHSASPGPIHPAADDREAHRPS